MTRLKPFAPAAPQATLIVGNRMAGLQNGTPFTEFEPQQAARQGSVTPPRTPNRE